MQFDVESTDQDESAEPVAPGTCCCAQFCFQPF